MDGRFTALVDSSLAQLLSLDGRTALVTGSGGGIGRAIARQLALAGANVAIVDIDEGKARASAAEIGAEAGTTCLAVQADVSERAEVVDAFAQIGADIGPVTVLVNNAGVAITHPAEQFPLEDWERTMAVNLRSALLCSQAAFGHMSGAGEGRIVNVASMYAIFGAAQMPAYAASKGGIVQLTRSLAVAWAEHGIAVNAVLPGFIDTELSRQGRREIPGMDAEVRARTPAGRWGDPADVARTVLFLASPCAAFVTGAGVAVDGGYSVR